MKLLCFAVTVSAETDFQKNQIKYFRKKIILFKTTIAINATFTSGEQTKLHIFN